MINLGVFKQNRDLRRTQHRSLKILEVIERAKIDERLIMERLGREEAAKILKMEAQLVGELTNCRKAIMSGLDNPSRGFMTTKPPNMFSLGLKSGMGHRRAGSVNVQRSRKTKQRAKSAIVKRRSRRCQSSGCLKRPIPSEVKQMEPSIQELLDSDFPRNSSKKGVRRVVRGGKGVSRRMNLRSSSSGLSRAQTPKIYHKMHNNLSISQNFAPKSCRNNSIQLNYSKRPNSGIFCANFSLKHLQKVQKSRKLLGLSSFNIN